MYIIRGLVPGINLFCQEQRVERIESLFKRIRERKYYSFSFRKRNLA